MSLPDYGVYLHGDIANEHKLLIREKIVKLANLQKPSQILDIGCGRGLIAIAFALSSKQHSVCAMDVWNQDEIYDNSSNWVVRNATTEGVDNLSVSSGDVRDIPFTSNVFDLVVSNLVIHNLPHSDQYQAFFEMARVLKPGGKLLYSDIDKEYQFPSAENAILKLGFSNLSLNTLLTFPYKHPVSVCALTALKPTSSRA